MSKKNCNDIRSISDITDQYDYKDENPSNKRLDDNLVSCGQDKNYNELEYIYDYHLKLLVDAGGFSEQDALDALCECCKKVENPRKRQDFYDCLNEKLGINLKYE